MSLTTQDIKNLLTILNIDSSGTKPEVLLKLKKYIQDSTLPRGILSPVEDNNNEEQQVIETITPETTQVVENSKKNSSCKQTRLFLFDLETTGIPSRVFGKCAPYHNTNAYNDARIVEIAYSILDVENGSVIKSFQQMVKPNKWIITNSHIHGITTEQANENGKPLELILSEIQNDLLSCDVICSYNLGFDLPILLSELTRLSPTQREPILNHLLHHMKAQCLMQIATTFCSSKKYVKLCDLYTQLFQKPIDNAHRALSDVNAAQECYFRLLATHPSLF